MYGKENNNAQNNEGGAMIKYATNLASLLKIKHSKYIILYNIKNMLFQKKHQKKVQTVWTVVCVIIIISMILLYVPGLFS